MTAQVFTLPADFLMPGDIIEPEYAPNGQIIIQGKVPRETLEEAAMYLENEGYTPRQGDIAFFPSLINWGNHARFIFTADGLEPLDYIYSEFGSPPPSLPIPDYPIHYWDTAIPGIEVVWLDIEPYINQLLDDLNNVSTSFVTPNDQQITTHLDRMSHHDRDDLMRRFMGDIHTMDYLPLRIQPKQIVAPVNNSNLFYPA
jgi:hypothetical protein